MSKRLLILLCWMINAHATDYTAPIIAQNGQVIHLNLGDRVTLPASQTVSALVSLNPNSLITAPGVTISTQNNTSFGASATNGGEIDLTDGTTIQTTGTGAFGINISAGRMSSNNFNVTTSGNNAHAIRAPNSPVNVTNAQLNTSGSGAFGVLSTGITSRFTGDHLTITTTGANSVGIDARTNLNQFVLNQSTIQTSGQNAHGVQAETGVHMTLSQLIVNTQGLNASGLVVSDSGSVLIGNNLTITTQSGSGLLVQNSGNTTLTDTIITSVAASAITLSNTTAENAVTLHHAQLTSPQDFAINAQNTQTNLTIEDSTLDNARLLNISNTSVVNATITNSNLKGAIQTAQDSTFNMDLLTNSIWQGSGNLNNLMIDPSVWIITGHSTISDALTNAGIIQYTPPNPNFKTLTVGYYVGSEGSLILNSVLAADNSPSDQLIIQNDTPTGTTYLTIQSSGNGAPTIADGILLIDVKNPTVANTNAFILQNVLLAGPYEYQLYRGSLDGHAPENWYLRSTILYPVNPNQPDSGQPGFDIIQTPNGPVQLVPNYRDEVSLFTALPSMELLYGRQLLGNLHQRMGQLFSNSLHDSGAWLRILQHQDTIDHQTIFNRGPSFNNTLDALQTGIDIYRQQTRYGQDQIGVYLGFGSERADVMHINRSAGRNHIDAASIGTYWTHHFNRSYVDCVLQTNHYEIQAYGPNTNLQTDHHEIDLTLESGYAFMLRHFDIEPQAQIIYQNLKGHDTSDGIAEIKFNRTQSYLGRLGLRLARTWSFAQRRFDSWCRFNYWHQMDGKSQTEFLSAPGFVPFYSSLPSDWVQAELGLSGEITSDIVWYANLGRSIYLNHGKGYHANLGLRLNI